MRLSKTAAGLAAGTTLVLAATSSPAAAEGPHIYHHNICGALGCKWYGGTITNNPLEYYISINDPDTEAIGTQETCYSQYSDFKSFLQNRSTYWRAATHENAAQTSACFSQTPVFYGVAAWALLPSDSSRTHEGSFTHQVSGDEDRGWACADGGTGSPTYGSCSAHMSGTNQTTSVNQTEEYYDIVQFRSLGYKQYWGGDLYVNTGEWPVNVSASYQEADYCSGGLRSTMEGGSGIRKPDWAFYGRKPVNCAGDAWLAPPDLTDLCSKTGPNNSCAAGEFPSDHRMIAGYQY